MVLRVNWLRGMWSDWRDRAYRCPECGSVVELRKSFCSDEHAAEWRDRIAY